MSKTKESEQQTSTNKVNLTIKLDKATLRKIRVIAAEQDTSISSLVAELIREKTEKRDTYEESKKRALARMERGIPFEGPMLTREQMHERH